MCCILVVSGFMVSMYFLNSLSGELKIIFERILSSFVFGVSASGSIPSLISYSAPVLSSSTALPSTRFSLIFFFFNCSKMPIMLWYISYSEFFSKFRLLLSEIRNIIEFYLTRQTLLYQRCFLYVT